MFGLRHPIVLAPMGGVAGGELAAAVSNAGGLGLVGGGYGDAAWLRRELSIVKAKTRSSWGVGFITWSVKRDVLELALAEKPHALMLSFGDPTPYAGIIREAGCKLICQVQDLASARRAQEAGADLIVAQGTEAGGHGGLRATLPLVPSVVDAVTPTPVIAAGGIADGRGLAAALMLGAGGALIGTRFYASPEALGSARAKRRLVDGDGDDTVRTRVFDIVRNLDWPIPFTGRALRNRFHERWHDREHPLAEAAQREARFYQEAVTAEDFDNAVVWAGESIDLIGEIQPAGDLVARIGAQAAAILGTAADYVSSNAAQNP
jgi:nitronate monooxygenase